MSYKRNEINYHGQGNPAYPIPPNPFTPQAFYSPPNYGVPPLYAPVPPLQSYPPYGFPPSPNVPHYPPQAYPSQAYPPQAYPPQPQAFPPQAYPQPMPYSPQTGSNWPIQSPMPFNGPNNNGRNNFRQQQPFKGHQRNWNDNNGRKRKHNNNNGFQQEHKKEKVQKIDRRDLPENNQFCCETCNRGFKTEEQLDTHIKAHVKCTFEGCDYMSHEKLMQLHNEHVHLSGYTSKLETSKNIEQWREERRKNYPTKENIARKEKEKQEAIEKGEFVEKKEKYENPKNNKERKNKKQKQKQQQGNNKQTESEVKSEILLNYPVDTKSTDESDTLSNVSQISSDKVDTSLIVTDLIDTTEHASKKEVKDEKPEELPSCFENKSTEDQSQNISSAAAVSKQMAQPKKQERAQKCSNPKKRQPIAKLLMERDIKKEMKVMLQVAEFFTSKIEEQEAKTQVVRESHV